MRDLHHSCQGESHIITNKVCQDASYSATTEAMSIAIVCDGHGGARYFRSDVGAQLAIKVTTDCINAFVRDIDVNILKGKPFTQKQAITSEAKASVLTKDTATDKALRQLFASIIYKWRQQIAEHAATNALTDEEKEKVEQRFQDDFANGIAIEKTYGCTLMCYVATSDYWFAFHVGDGKCIAFDDEGKWCEPIPWDERCFLNKTTSLCDSSALDEFRYCYCGDGTYPMAMCLGSDGIDDSFGATENMVNFYVQLLKLLVNEGEERTIQSLEDTLPQLSKIGSKDDMSVACVYNEQSLSANIKSLISWQQQNVGDNISQINNRILKQKDIIRTLQAEGLNNQKTMIDYQYAQKEVRRAFEEKKSLVEKWNHFSKELYGEDFSPYGDEIGVGDMQERNSEEAQSQETEQE